MLHPGICIKLTSQNMQNTAVKLHQDPSVLFLYSRLGFTGVFIFFLFLLFFLFLF